MKEKAYVAIDLKSFYASVECVERGLDPLTTNLVVADMCRTEKTICLAVTPALKAFGIPGRARLFEVIERVREVNYQRRMKAPGRKFTGKSTDAEELKQHPELELDYIVAPPRMALYVDFSTRIYDVYTRYISPEDIHVYSIDEVFMDVTGYLRTYKTTPRELTMRMIRDVLSLTGITATAGIGTNLYLCKIAMDIVAKRIPADKDGVRIAELTEQTYREKLWEHRPLTDFWRIGRGYATKLERYGMHTMGDVAWRSVYDESLLYNLFGVNAELLIDHAWGWEPCLISDIKAYKPQSNSLSVGQVLTEPYTCEKTRVVVREMTESLVLDMVEKGLATDIVELVIGYDIENLSDPQRRAHYHGPVVTDHYGRQVPKSTHGSLRLGQFTSSTRKIMEAMMEIFDRIVDPSLLTRRINVVAGCVKDERKLAGHVQLEQLNMFTDYAELEKIRKEEAEARKREKGIQHAMLEIRSRFGKNAILRGTNFLEGATGRERNRQIGGHKA
ncbi:MAG: DNA methylase [Clostridiales bacterium]|nr:DNA methylase [Clostridiales bacterium]